VGGAAGGVIAGAVLMSAAGVTIAVGIPVASMSCYNPRHCWAYVIPSVLSAGLLIAGLVLLDEEGTLYPNFQKLDAEQRSQFMITEQEYAVYESELEEISAATETGAVKAIRAQAETAQAARPYFDSEFANLSLETRSVMAKIVRANFAAE
jgi:hypothetical protein